MINQRPKRKTYQGYRDSDFISELQSHITHITKENKEIRAMLKGMIFDEALVNLETHIKELEDLLVTCHDFIYNDSEEMKISTMELEKRIKEVLK
jgi:hypothetical protein